MATSRLPRKDTAFHETKRLAAVRASGLSPGDVDPALEAIVEVAAATARTPIALISIVDDTDVWFPARVGLELPSAARDQSLCSVALESLDEPFVVPDAQADDRFRDSPLVTGPPYIRFYAGVPIATSDGFAIGVLSVIDTVPRPALSSEERGVLPLLAAQVEQRLELRRTATELERTTAALERGQEALDAERGFLSAALASLTEGIVACDATARLTFFNGVAEQMHGVAADARIDPDRWSEHYDLYETDGVTPLPRDRIPLMCALAGEQVHDARMVIAPVDRPPLLVSCSGRAVHGPNGELLGAVVTMRDVTEHHRSEAALRHSAEHDVLTGLPNRAAFSRQLESALAGDRWQRTAVCFIDLNDFKRVNDDLGHTVGDQVLAAVAGRLHQAVKDVDTVARFGGDEFVVLVEDVAEDDVPAIVARIHDALRPPLRIGTRMIAMTAAIGVAHAGAERRRDERSLLRLADQRMYENKRT